MQHLDDLGPARPPLGQRPPGVRLRLVAKRQRRQRAQDELDVVDADAEADPHVRGLEALVQRLVARRHRSHQHIGAARGVLGERLHGDVDADRRAAVAGVDRERLEREPDAPGVVERDRRASGARRADQRDQVGEFHRHRSRRLDPDEPRPLVDRRGERRRIHRVVDAVRDAPAGELVTSEFLARPVGVVGKQQLVAALQERHRDQRDRRQAARHEQRLHAAFERGDPLLERERRRRSVQAVGVARLLAPVARAHRGDVGEDDRRRLVDPRLHRDEAGRRPVGVRDQRGAAPRRLLLHGVRRGGIRSASRPGRGRRRRRCARA